MRVSAEALSHDVTDLDSFFLRLSWTSSSSWRKLQMWWSTYMPWPPSFPEPAAPSASASGTTTTRYARHKRRVRSKLLSTQDHRKLVELTPTGHAQRTVWNCETTDSMCRKPALEWSCEITWWLRITLKTLPLTWCSEFLNYSFTIWSLWNDLEKNRL